MADDNSKLAQALHALEGTAAVFANQLFRDDKTRQAYIELTREQSKAIRAAVASGELTPEAGGKAAYQMRDELLEMMRLRSSPVGREAAKQMKAKSPAFEALLDKYAQKLAGKPFEMLGEADKARVFDEVIASSGRANPKVSARMARLGELARGLWFCQSRSPFTTWLLPTTRSAKSTRREAPWRALWCSARSAPRWVRWVVRSVRSSTPWSAAY